MGKKKESSAHLKELFMRVEGYAKGIKGIYLQAIDKLIALALRRSPSAGITPSLRFAFKNNAYLSSQATLILRELYTQVYTYLKESINNEWELSNKQNDKLIEQLFGKSVMDKNHLAKYFARNKESVDAFFKRKDPYGGLNLSQKVWKYTSSLKHDIERAISISLAEGKSAITTAANIKRYLQNPEGLPSLNTKAGIGIYRSAIKNALRLTRTETNMAYLSADHARWQKLDFVVGYEVRLSNNHTLNGRPFTDICDDLKGRYPKSFKFTGWHPQCRCYAVPILCSEKELVSLQRGLLEGSATPKIKSIERVPAAFNKWVKENASRAATAKSTPYFIDNNFKEGKLERGLKS